MNKDICCRKMWEMALELKESADIEERSIAGILAAVTASIIDRKIADLAQWMSFYAERRTMQLKEIRKQKGGE